MSALLAASNPRRRDAARLVAARCSAANLLVHAAGHPRIPSEALLTVSGTLDTSPVGRHHGRSCYCAQAPAVVASLLLVTALNGAVGPARAPRWLVRCALKMQLEARGCTGTGPWLKLGHTAARSTAWRGRWWLLVVAAAAAAVLHLPVVRTTSTTADTAEGADRHPRRRCCPSALPTLILGPSVYGYRVVTATSQGGEGARKKQAEERETLQQDGALQERVGAGHGAGHAGGDAVGPTGADAVFQQYAESSLEGGEHRLPAGHAVVRGPAEEGCHDYSGGAGRRARDCVHDLHRRRVGAVRSTSRPSRRTSWRRT